MQSTLATYFHGIHISLNLHFTLPASALMQGILGALFPWNSHYYEHCLYSTAACKFVQESSTHL
jgi:hypothetical protein